MREELPQREPPEEPQELEWPEELQELEWLEEEWEEKPPEEWELLEWELPLCELGIEPPLFFVLRFGRRKVKGQDRNAPLR